VTDPKNPAAVNEPPQTPERREPVAHTREPRNQQDEARRATDPDRQAADDPTRDDLGENA